MHIKGKIKAAQQILKQGGVLNRFLKTNLSKYDFFWRFLNKKSNRRYQACERKDSAFIRGVISEVNEIGYSKRSLSEMINSDELDELYDEISMRFRRPPRRKDSSWVSSKNYIDYYEGGFYPELQDYNPANIFHRLAIHEDILEIVHTYFDAIGHLCHIELNQCNVIESGDDIEGSQRPHRDPALRYSLKVFIYWSDVSDDDGPFSYCPKTHFKGDRNDLAPRKKLFGGSYYPHQDELKSARFDNLIGSKGTIIFCDTSGLHFGGIALKNPRRMSTFVYYPEVDILQPRLKISEAEPMFSDLKTRQKITLGHLNADL
ncbi:hypothetical protein OAJ48_00405 [Gammaproteobacteria bacterium]|nr:hypothetical protein [Gammaproteobacteria bacterium]